MTTLDSQALNRSIGDLTSALGDPTRRGVYIAVRQAPNGLTASTVSELFGIHSNVARHHLDRLAEDGYVEVTTRRAEGKAGPGAGRPAKWYTATSKVIDVHFPARQPDLLSDLLLKVLEQVAPDNVSEVARDVGRAYGRNLAAEIGVPDDPGFEGAVRAVVGAMTGVGFGISADVDSSRLLTNHCPFGETAVSHPEVVCALDQGLVVGLMESIDPACRPTLTPHATADEDCVTEVRISAR